MARVLLLQESATARCLLADLLEQCCEIIDTGGAFTEHDFDLCITDEPLLERYRESIENRRTRDSPRHLPVLLFMPRGAAHQIEDRLWRITDDILSSPLDPPVARKRVCNLLKMRRLSSPQPDPTPSEESLAAQRLRTIAELAADYAYEMRVASDGEVQHEWLSGPLARTVGASSHGCGSGDPWQRLIAPCDLPILDQRRQALLSGNDHSCELRIVLPTGEQRWVRDHCRHLDDGSGLIIGAAIDITSAKAMTDELRRAHSSLVAGRLASGIAHDFNNLLQVMLGIVEPHRRQTLDPTTSAVLVELEEQIRRGAELTQQILRLHRHEAAAREAVDLNQVLAGASRLMGRLVRENVHIRLHTTRDPLAIQASRGQLEQVLMNLVLNASDAMPSGGEIWIRSGGDPEAVWFEVEDCGVGMPEAVRSRIFEPSYTTKRADRGTGLGLTVVQDIVSQHNGRIEIESREHHGSRFRIELPRPAGDLHAAACASACERTA